MSDEMLRAIGNVEKPLLGVHATIKNTNPPETSGGLVFFGSGVGDPTGEKGFKIRYLASLQDPGFSVSQQYQSVADGFQLGGVVSGVEDGLSLLLPEADLPELPSEGAPAPPQQGSGGAGFRIGITVHHRVLTVRYS